MQIYLVDALYSLDAPRFTLGYFTTRKLAENEIKSVMAKPPEYRHCSDLQVHEINVIEE